METVAAENCSVHQDCDDWSIGPRKDEFLLMAKAVEAPANLKVLLPEAVERLA